MESKMALTTPSTSRWVRSGKSVQSFCTSSERIIVVPASRMKRPNSPVHTGRLGMRLSGKLAVRKQDYTALSQKNAAYSKAWLFLLGLFPSLGLFERLAQN